MLLARNTSFRSASSNVSVKPSRRLSNPLRFQTATFSMSLAAPRSSSHHGLELFSGV